ncbi:uncharacterized protein SAPINGB_P004128 [Magnusiomyces paraingens]|uniref:NAD-dependent epimerase/dehydratase domain-containing protein n=1 Tax=Magnusiomyces paraingens TaxID=2606893 RepID=A0A5E8BSW6_9ASCO|nr:uncharacterized protein SAPINGB_P004128 [Saprochaete ingens]VVT54543.1 unnamed protein product [Saprochaete ingens]
MTHSKVLLTGASGFLGIYVLKTLFEHGYSVKATVRSKEKGDYLIATFPNKPLEIAIVEDIQEPDAFDEALKDTSITAVIHTASPFFSAKTDPVKELLDPAIKGTKNILRAIKTHAPQVTTVVITSSNAAINNVSKYYDHSFVHTEKTWADVTWDQAISDLNLTYRGSKTFAERAFWDFIAEEKPNFTGTTVNPTLIFGPLLQQVASPEAINTSNAFLWKFLIHSKPNDTTDTYSNNPDLWVDVRDVALAHVLPLEKPSLAGKRLFLTSDFYTVQTLLDIVNERVPALRGKIAIGQPGTGNKNVEKVYQYDNHVTNELLGIKYHTLDDTIVETVNSLLELKDNNA